MKWIAKTITIPASTTDYEETIAKNTTAKRWRFRRILIASESTVLSDVGFSFYIGAEKVFPDEGELRPITKYNPVDVDFVLPGGSELKIKGANSTASDITIFFLLGYVEE